MNEELNNEIRRLRRDSERLDWIIDRPIADLSRALLIELASGKWAEGVSMRDIARSAIDRAQAESIDWKDILNGPKR